MINDKQLQELNWIEYTPNTRPRKWYIETSIDKTKVRYTLMRWLDNQNQFEVTSRILENSPFKELRNLANGSVTNFNGKIENEEQLKTLMKMLSIV